MAEPQWCPFCGKPLADELGDPWCASCRIDWTADADGYRQMRVAKDSSIYRRPIAQPFRRLPRATIAELRVFAEMVHPLFEANGWLYGFRDEARVPTVDDIVAMLDRLQQPSFEGQDRVDNMSGRLRARAGYTDRVEFYLELGPPEPQPAEVQG